MLRLALLTALVMVAFAANSVLNRMALAGSAIGAFEFAAIRLVSGAAILALLVLLRDRNPGALAHGGPIGAAALALYVLGFSIAYLALDAGIGALILFGGVQVTMFAGAVIGGERVPPARVAGAFLALAGLAWLLWPTGVAVPSLLHGGLMALAALGWGLYSLRGRGSRDALGATAGNFLLAAPIALGALLLAPPQDGALTPTPTGIVLALLSGIVTSGLGYALWYRLLPQITASSAALAQLSVPLIAVAGGALLLGEPPTARLWVAAALIIGGIAIGLVGARSAPHAAAAKPARR
ncbi:DMT family transporter [Profundibacterium mesophilum]|uniref:Regulator of sigma E protease n=1 Tax=Profundibacterium mesophilum KAUST100406-0324 TaxID=1037889 RepID=A0A921NPU5_9RHOB|nr:DMT family transporter [Profundibacterium mesophilum]KAF0675772.1 regulator of sigma E protease [Profundibacterium mesophilum KAUST100406-0324]